MSKIDNLKLVGNEYRIRILCLLNVAPCTVSELREVLDLSTANTSKYLKQLVAGKMISYIKLGTYNYYYINFDFAKLFPDVVDIINNCKDEIIVVNDKNMLKSKLNETRMSIRSKLMFNNTELENLMINQIHIENLDDLSRVIDIREAVEYDLYSLKGTINIPMSQILVDPEKYFEYNKSYQLICQTQTRSLHLAKLLKNLGYDISVIIGGVDYCKNSIDTTF